MSNNYTLQGMDISPYEFLTALFAPSENICIRILKDRKDDNSAFSQVNMVETLKSFDMMNKEESAVIKKLKAHNEKNRAVYYVINHGGHEDEKINRINAQFMECDHLSLEEQLAQIKAFPLEPSLIVKTQKSLHCYWLIKKGSVKRFRHIQKQLVARFGADASCINESRIFRLPGFYHCKFDPVMVEVIKFNPELRYEQDELAAVLPDIPDETAVTTRPAGRGTNKGLVLTGKQCLFLQHCKKNAKALPEPDWYAMITNLAVFEGGEDTIHKLSKPYPKYSFDETQKKINHFYKSKTKPMTCQTIAEKGFKCPKLGICKCKSPAGLAYFPLDVAGLAKMLAGVKPKKNPSLDIQLARQFVDDYLFNVEPAVAEVFINNDIKAHFGFKGADIKGLPSYHKELHKAFNSTQDARREKMEQSGGTLEPWFELTERGGKRFMPSVLADYCAKNENVFFCADRYYFYENGVYVMKDDDLDAKKVIRHHMKYVMTMVSREPRQIVGFDVQFDKGAYRLQGIVDNAPDAEKYSTDGNMSYLDVVFPGKHIRNVRDKRDTHIIESINADLRHYISGLARRSRCFYRRLETLQAVLEVLLTLTTSTARRS